MATEHEHFAPRQTLATEHGALTRGGGHDVGTQPRREFTSTQRMNTCEGHVHTSTCRRCMIPAAHMHFLRSTDNFLDCLPLSKPHMPTKGYKGFPPATPATPAPPTEDPNKTPEDTSHPGTCPPTRNYCAALTSAKLHQISIKCADASSPSGPHSPTPARHSAAITALPHTYRTYITFNTANAWHYSLWSGHSSLTAVKPQPRQMCHNE
jgi:hypothetical protein